MLPTAIAMRAKMPLQQQQGRLRIDDDNNAIATRGQHQLQDSNEAITTRATTLSRIKGNDAIVMRVTTPSIHWQGCLHIGNGNNTIIMRVTRGRLNVHCVGSYYSNRIHFLVMFLHVPSIDSTCFPRT
jgi:hypothetical protein